MAADFGQIYHEVCAWAEARGIHVARLRLPAGKAGEFDGVSARMNTAYPVEECVYYLAHALGSMVRWALSHEAVRALFEELRAAKEARSVDAARLERAIAAYRGFEVESSEFAVWMLEQLGYPSVIRSYTNFLRADLEALTAFHRHGKAPVWRDFFAQWNEDVAQGRRQVEPFHPKPIPPFTPVRTEKQEILQEQGDGHRDT